MILSQLFNQFLMFLNIRKPNFLLFMIDNFLNIRLFQKILLHFLKQRSVIYMSSFEFFLVKESSFFSFQSFFSCWLQLELFILMHWFFKHSAFLIALLCSIEREFKASHDFLLFFVLPILFHLLHSLWEFKTFLFQMNFRLNVN